jgi:hypothetical protein
MVKEESPYWQLVVQMKLIELMLPALTHRANTNLLNEQYPFSTAEKGILKIKSVL